jgi:hypothetical protein
MPPSTFAYFRNGPFESRSARTTSFRIFATDFRPRIQLLPLHLPSDAISLYPSGNADTQVWGDPAHRGPFRGLKQNP